MKKLKLIYNSMSGERLFRYDLDLCIKKFQQGGYEVHMFTSLEHGDIRNHILTMEKSFYDMVVVSGGDGTLNIVINAFMEAEIFIPIAIIPSGTANDFANYLKMPRDNVEACCDLIIKGNKKQVDLGVVNGTYFINVCGAGLFATVSQRIDSDFKNALGKLAYYLKGIEELPNFSCMPLRITNSTEVIEKNIFFFVALNSAGAGGFEKLSADAKIDDGLLDFIAFKEMGLVEMAALFIKILKGEHLNDPNIIFFQDDYIKIELLSNHDERLLATDVDGESGPLMPIEITLVKKPIEMICC